ncbi:phosphopantetheine-binding protein [Nostoc sp.]|uniref:phosphopantetheine-binding protein n=1 Tax=Nostoc sp. TaxID=1180 RepID=UPI002FFB6723
MKELITKSKISFEDFCQAISQRLQIDINLLHPSALWVKDIGITSVDIVKIALLLRQKFGVKVSTSQLGKIKTVQDAYELLNFGVKNE